VIDTEQYLFNFSDHTELIKEQTHDNQNKIKIKMAIKDWIEKKTDFSKL
jgi:hypothetical protein